MRIESAGTLPSSFMEKLEQFIQENRLKGHTVTVMTNVNLESSVADPSESDGECYRHVRNESDLITNALK